MKHLSGVPLYWWPLALPTNIRLERLATDKHSSLLRKFVNYGRKKFYTINSFHFRFLFRCRAGCNRGQPHRDLAAPGARISGPISGSGFHPPGRRRRRTLDHRHSVVRRQKPGSSGHFRPGAETLRPGQVEADRGRAGNDFCLETGSTSKSVKTG